MSGLASPVSRQRRSFLWVAVVCGALALAACSEHKDEAAPSPPPPSPHPEYHHAHRAEPRPESLAPKDNAASDIAGRGALLAKLPLAKVVLDAPKDMTSGDKKQVELRLGVNVPDQELTRPNEPHNQQIPGEAHVSAQVQVDLDGPGFVIEPKTARQQSIAEGFPAVWRWDVQAQDPGERVLTATIYALVADNGATAPQQVKSYSQPVEVRVKPKSLSEWLSDIAQDADKVKAILGSIAAIAAIVGGWFGFTKLRDKSSQNN
jgi:hypothetical protein